MGTKLPTERDTAAPTFRPTLLWRGRPSKQLLSSSWIELRSSCLRRYKILLEHPQLTSAPVVANAIKSDFVESRTRRTDGRVVEFPVYMQFAGRTRGGVRGRPQLIVLVGGHKSPSWQQAAARSAPTGVKLGADRHAPNLLLNIHGRRLDCR